MVLHMRGKGGLRQALCKCAISIEQVGREVEAQIDAFKSLTGAPPVYLDGHQHVHVLPGIAAVVARVAAKHGVRYARIPEEQPEHFEQHIDAARCTFFRSVISQAADARAVYRDEGLDTPHAFVGFGLMGKDLTRERLFLRLQALRAEAGARTSGACSRRTAVCDWDGKGQVYVGEYMCHAGHAAVRGDDFNMAADRDHELLVLSDASLRPWLLKNRIKLTSYHALSMHESRQCASPVCASNRPDSLQQRDSHACACGGLEAPQRTRRHDTAHAQRYEHGMTGEDGDGDGDESVGEKRAARRGLLLILSSMTAATGNATTALRLAAVARVCPRSALCARRVCSRLLLSHFPCAPSPSKSTTCRLKCPRHRQKHGWEASCKDVGELHDAKQLRVFVREQGVTAVLGVHAYRAGKLLQGSDVPYSIVLGGTDVNVMADDEDKRRVMQLALDKAAAVLAFSREMLTKMSQVPACPSPPSSHITTHQHTTSIASISVVPLSLWYSGARMGA